MSKLTVLFGPQGSGKTNTALSLTLKMKTYLEDFDSPSRPLRMGEVLHRKPECVVVDGCPLDQIDFFKKLASQPKLQIKHAITGMHEIKTPKFYLIIVNNVTPEEVLVVAGGRNIELIECTRKEDYDV